MVRICIIGNSSSIHIHRWLKYFRDRGYDVHFIGKQQNSHVLPENVVRHLLPDYSFSSKVDSLLNGLLVRSIVQRVNPDIVHSHFAVLPSIWGAISGFHPFLITAWGSDLLVVARSSRVLRALIRWSLHRADFITCVSESLANEAHLLGIDTNKIEVAHWGIRSDIFYPSSSHRQETQSNEDTSSRSRIILSLRPVKDVQNPLVIADAIPQVLTEFPNTRFIVRTYGADSRILREFENIVEASRVSDNVNYIGELETDEAIADLYRTADIVISIPSTDGMPLSVLESIACGSVPVVSDIPSLREYYQHEREVLFVPTNDSNAVANATIRLIRDSELFDNMRSNGMNLVKEKADSTVLMNRYETIYNMLISDSIPHVNNE